MTDNRHEESFGSGPTPVKVVRAPSFVASPEIEIATAIVDVARALVRSVPPPRGAPYFGLDVKSAFDLESLGFFCTRGIFRKYEFALDIGSGLGGRARWLAARSGCRIVGIEPHPAAVLAATMLNRRARMHDQVTFQAGQPDRLPLRGRVFTHVWIVVDDEAQNLRAWFPEAFRVLRPGAHFAMQCPASPAQERALFEALRLVGFIEPERRDIVLSDVPQTWRFARDRFDRTLQHLRLEVAECWREMSTHPPVQRWVQMFARRPA